MENNNLNSPKEYALYYLQNLGISIFPLRSNPPAERKEPVLGWRAFITRHPSVQEIEQWFIFNPSYNIALVTGNISKIIAIDVDGETAKKRIEDKLGAMSEDLKKVLNETMVTKTGGGGLHIVFRLAEPTDISQKTIWRTNENHTQILLQGNGHYVVAAPSIHPNGNRYEWNDKELKPITKQQLDEFIELVGLTELIHETTELNPAAGGERTSSTNYSTEEARTLTPEQMQNLLWCVQPVYIPGDRNDIIYHLPGAMRKESITHQSTRQFVTLLSNAAREKYPDEDLRKSLEKVDRTFSLPIQEVNGKSGLYAALVGTFGEDGKRAFEEICQHINNPIFLPDTDIVVDTKDADKPGEPKKGAGQSKATNKVSENVVVKLGRPDGDGGGAREETTTDEEDSKEEEDEEDEAFNKAGDWLTQQRNKWLSQNPKKEAKAFPIIPTLCDEILQREKCETLIDTKEKDIWWYKEDNGIFQPGGEHRIAALIEQLAGYAASGHVEREILRHVQNRTQITRKEFDTSPSIINVQNGLLDIFTWELKEHTSDYLSTFQYPMDYDPEAECPTTEKFLTDVIQDPFKLREFLKFWAYVLLKDCRYEKGLMCVGGGANGKGTLVRLTEAQEGGFDKCSHVGLDEIGNDRFATASLYGKTLNTVADLKDDKIKSSGNVKTMISGDSMEGQFKHMPRFTFRNRAKLFYSANSPPETDDKSYAFFRRWLVIGFDRTFINTDDESDPNKKDSQLLEKLLTPQEMSGILNLRLKYLKVLISEGGFEEESFETIKHEYESRAEHVSRFIRERCIADFTNFNTDFRTDTQTLYAEYLSWAKENKIDSKVILADNTFGGKMAEFGHKKKDRKRKGGKRGYEYMHIRLKQGYVDGNQVELMDAAAVQTTITNHQNSDKKPQICQVCNQQLLFLKELQIHTIFRHPEQELPTSGEEEEPEPESESKS
jgi:P4 family phage/plasmid primase-like protien